jgi:prepilin-type N-terminal cleavage/methylation domain-containing protein
MTGTLRESFYERRGGGKRRGMALRPGTSVRRNAIRKGFSLIELLVVAAVVSLLFAIGLPSISRAKKHARRMQCLSQQRQIALAIHGYVADHRDSLPIAQYFDEAGAAVVAWDTITESASPERVRPGLIWQYIDGGAVQQCPGYEGPSLTSGDPYTGYNYNVTYLGRGQGEGDHQSLGESPATLSRVRFTSAALVGDGGWRGGTNKFMRAPQDEGATEATVHAGAQAFRHLDATCVTAVDGHGRFTRERFRKPGARRSSESILGWPHNGFLSEDDRAYRHR